MSIRLKKEFLKLLEEDEEFRYAVVGYLGISDLLKNLEKLSENQNRLWEEVKALKRDFGVFDKHLASLEKRIDRLEKGMGSLAKAVGTTLDHYTAVFVEELLRSSGVSEDKIDVRVDVVLSFKDIERGGYIQ